jgi:hypothetical protein
LTWILLRLADAGLVKGKALGIDATTLEANAALRSIVRRDTGASYQEFLTQLALASGIDTPTREDLARIDWKCPKKDSNDDWTHPLDPDAKITRIKDGRTHLAHKAEHAVDLETGAVVAVTVQDADEGDTATSVETLIEAAEQVETIVPNGEIKEVVLGVSRAVIRWWSTSKRSACGATSPNPIAAAATGRTILNRVTPSTAIGDGFAVHAASGCCGSGASGWIVLVPTSTKRVGCAEYACAGTTIFANGCWCMPVGSKCYRLSLGFRRRATRPVCKRY